MKIIPSKKIKIISNLLKEDIISILNNNTQEIRDRKHFLFQKEEPNEYEGNIFNDEFEIQKIIYGRNSFSPLVNGTIIEKDGNTMIQLNLELRSYPLVFVIIFLGSIGVTFLVLLIGIFTAGFNHFFCVPPLIIFLILRMIMNFEFNREARIIQNDLANLFKGKIEENN